MYYLLYRPEKWWIKKQNTFVTTLIYNTLFILAQGHKTALVSETSRLSITPNFKDFQMQTDTLKRGLSLMWRYRWKSQILDKKKKDNTLQNLKQYITLYLLPLRTLLLRLWFETILRSIEIIHSSCRKLRQWLRSYQYVYMDNIWGNRVIHMNWFNTAEKITNNSWTFSISCKKD